MLDRHSTSVSEEFAKSNARRTTKVTARAAPLGGLFCLHLCIPLHLISLCLPYLFGVKYFFCSKQGEQFNAIP
jgi:hypothetical protein